MPCNPINMPYFYQFNAGRDGALAIGREAADPSLVYFKGKYLIFPSMTGGFMYSDDLIHWDFHATPELPAYDYAPDVCAVGEELIFCASSHERCAFYRTSDPFSGEYEVIESAFTFWDPKLYCDDDGRLYLYWGSSGSQPIFGIELDAKTLAPIGGRVALFANDEEHKGYERRGEDHVPARSEAQKEAMRKQMMSMNLPPERLAMALDYISDSGYIEGAWMNKHAGRYYLQYGTPGEQFNIYADGVYVSDKPLGPFALAENNPFSYKPGGFLPGAGHGSTAADETGALWHVSTMRVSVNHVFERRIGIWPAGWDADGELFCNQRYGDWPYDIEALRRDPWANPEHMLLSYGVQAAASSCEEGHPASCAADENVRTWWKAATCAPGEWIELDLGRGMDVRAVQVNFADDALDTSDAPGIGEAMAHAQANMSGSDHVRRYIDMAHQPTRWLLEGSADGEHCVTLCDKRGADTDLPHDFVELDGGAFVRYVRLTVTALPYGQRACVSGLRVFGHGEGERPAQVAQFICERKGALDLDVSWTGDAVGYVVCFGHAADKLYHSYMTFAPHVHLGSLVAGQEIYIRIDSFNESGIAEGVTARVHD